MKRVGVATEPCGPRAFLRMERQVYGHAPRRFADPKIACERAVRSGAILLLTSRDGAPAARALVRAIGGTAFFSLFEAAPDAEAARSLCVAMRAFAEESGCARLVGPVPPDGSGFGVGVRLPEGDACAGHAPWSPQNPSYYADLLRACGLREESRLLTLRRPLGEDPYPGAAAWARRRGIAVAIRPLGRRDTLEAAWSVCEDARAAGKEAFARVCGRVAELAPDAFAALAFAGAEQNAAAWALCVPEGPVIRILHLQALPRWRGSPCAAALLDTAWREAARLGAREIVAGTIDAANPHSLPMARHAGFQPDAAWAVFAQDLRQCPSDG